MNMTVNSQCYAVPAASRDVAASRKGEDPLSRQAISHKMPKQEELQVLTDRDLIGRINEDDMDAWEELMGRHVDKAFQIAYGILGQRNDAEEVTQDAFVRIYKALPKFRGDAEFTTWMYRIVVNQARNKYRWNKRRGAHVNVSIDQDFSDQHSVGRQTLHLPDTCKTPDYTLMQVEFEGEIADEIQKLPPVNREALLLRNVKNLSYEQIAELLGVKVGTIKSRIARAREELRRRLR
jgi:RNA polymerase sigma-70 factor (ECF subfamily)